MRKNINTQHIEGRIYQHNLSVKTVKNQSSANFGKEFISGTLDIAVDEDGLNVVQVHFTYVTPTTKNGGKNATFGALKKIIDESKSWMTDGKDAATKVKVDSNSLALNDFYAQDDTLVSVKMNEGGFVSIVTDLCDEGERNTFTMDMVITNTKMVEPEDENEESFLSVRGVVFNFRNDILPVEFVVKNPDGIKYFDQIGASPSEPIYTKVWGKICCTTVTTIKKEESAFGEAAVASTSRSKKEWIITGTAKVPYDFGETGVLTANELTTAMQNREVYLADIKKRADEYRASRAASATQAFSSGAAMNLPGGDAMAVAKGNFNF